MKVCKDVYKSSTVSPAMGYVFGNDKDIGTMFLEDTAKLKLHDKKSKVNGVDCYVIEAEVPNGGEYTVWIDPDHGFNIARMQSKRGAGDLYHGRPLMATVSWNNSYEVVEFQKVDDAWLPKTYKMQEKSVDGANDFAYKREGETSLYSVNLDPDHDALGSFLHDDIPNGTMVLLPRIPPNVQFTWQDGEIVAEVDDSALEQLDKMTEEILADAKKRKSVPSKAVVNNSITLSKILAEYAKSQKQITSFYCVSSTAVKEQKAFPSRYACDGNRFCVKVKGAAKGVDCFVWDGKQSIHSSVNSGRSKKVLASGDKKKPYHLLATVYPGAALLGYLNGQPQRIDAMLSKASKAATVTEEKLNRKSCYVVNAVIGKDTYRVWFLPANGYLIARAEVKTNSRVVYLLDQVRFKKVEDNWVPMSCAIKDSTRQYTYKRTKIDLKPDFKKLKAFDLPISNGTPVTIENKSGKFIWRNGHIVDKEGKDVL